MEGLFYPFDSNVGLSGRQYCSGIQLPVSLNLFVTYMTLIEDHSRYRLIPTFGRSTIRRVSENTSALKKLAGRDFEDYLQVNMSYYPSYHAFSQPRSVQYQSLKGFSPIQPMTRPFWTCCSHLLIGTRSPSCAFIRTPPWSFCA